MSIKTTYKKLLSAVLAMAILLSSLLIPGIVASAEDTVEIWDGTVATSFAGGTGTADDPYIIENGAQLAFAIQYNTADNSKYNKHFSLANDIYLNDITKIDWKTGEIEAGYTPTTWIHSGIKDGNSGYIHGNGHAVYGLYINEPENGATTRVGLVPMTWNGVKFYDLGMDYTYINTQGPASFFIGYGKSSSSTYSEFENCWVGKNSTLISAGSASGFAYGQFKYITFKDCYSLANITSTSGGKAAAFAGDVWGPSTMWFKNCYATSAFALNYTGPYTNCYSTAQSADGLTQIEAAKMEGAAAQTNMPMLGADFAVTESYPVLKAQRDAATDIWGGFLAVPADADENGEYEIYTPEQLAWYAKNGGSAKLMNDIRLNDLKVTITDGTPALAKASDNSALAVGDASLLEWFGTGTALGATSSLVYTFNGDGNVIYGLYHNHGGTGGGANYAGIFNQISGGTSIYGVGIEDAYMVSNGAWSAAFLIGRENGVTYTIDSCYAGANTYHKGYDVAALVGGGGTPSTPATIKNCYVLTTLSGSHGTAYTNAFTGDNWSAKAANYYNCYTSHSSAYRSGTTVEDLFTGVNIMEGGGRGAAMSMAGLGEAFVTTESYPALRIFLDEIDEDVNLEMGTSLFSGSGTEEDPYLISDAQNLKDMVGLGGLDAYYELTNDIYLNDVDAVDWLTGTVNEGFAPETWFVGKNENGTGYISYVDGNDAFDGTVNGNGYAIHGLYYELGNNSTVGGLVPYANNVTLINLGIEDSFIGSGRFTGGFVGYGKTADLSGCWIDDSCAVFGWDAGADYVDADSDVNVTGGGDGLCRGSATYTYKEDASGTYIKDGETYRTFTAADYDGTKYTYDAETDTYTESADGTYRLDGENYVEITIADYTGTRYSVDDVIFTSAVFTSNALGGLVGRYITSGTIENCYVTAAVKSKAVYAFGQEDQGVTFANPGANGGGIGHFGGLWGDDWGAKVSATDCFSIVKAHESISFDATLTAFEDVYTLSDGSATGVTKVSIAQGIVGLDEMSGLDTDVWYAVCDSTDYPQLRIRGTVIGDVSENGIGAELSDAEDLRMTLIGENNFLNTDFTRDGDTNVCDLVALTLKADEKTAMEEEAAQLLLENVYVSSTGSDSNAGTQDAPVATLTKAYSLVQDEGYINVVDTVEVTALPKGDKLVYISGGAVDMSSLSTVNFGCDTYFNDTTIVFADDCTVYANGNDLLIETGVTVEGIPAAIYGGGNSAVAETYLDLRAGSYKAIYGGGDTGAVIGSTNLYLYGNVNKDLTFSAAGDSYVYGGGNTGTVYGDTTVDISGNVNAPLDHTSHTAIARLYGGSKSGDVKGDTWVYVSENAEFNYIYGGCASGTVGGSTNIEFSAYAMSIYGGSGTVSETNVTVNGGWVHQVFGGCEGSSMTGDTFVTIMGGTIDRRIVGGCYNNATRSGLSMEFTSENFVTGNTTVTLYDEATYTLSGDDWGITALSRHSTNHEAENGTLIFENSALQSSLSSKLGIKWLLGTLAPAADTQTVQ